MNSNYQKPEIPPSLDDYGDRKWIIPAEVRGVFRRYRNWVHGFLLGFFLLSPWLYVGGKQMLLLDIGKREFHFFGLSLYAHDAPLFFFVLAIIVFGLVFVTTVWGRVFCGWACPQTVFIDAVFRRIEIITEGTYLERRRLANSPWTSKKFFKKALKWFLYILAASLIAHSFIAFFVGSQNLLHMMGENPKNNWSYFVLVSSFTLVILLDFAWFREQFCLIVCPYGRFQSVLLGRRTLNIAYDVQRGEPRRGVAKPGEAAGDCVSCRRCVEVCPTGIDIRHGLQLECIACTACIDACDEIMEKVNKPKGLIRYMNTFGNSNWSLRSPRAIFSLSVVILAIGLLGFSLFQRADVDVTVLRGADQLFQSLNENGVEYLTNHYKLHIKNQKEAEVRWEILVQSDDIPLQVITAQNPILLKANESREVHVFIKFEPSLLQNGKRPAVLRLRSSDDSFVEKSITLVGATR